MFAGAWKNRPMSRVKENVTRMCWQSLRGVGYAGGVRTVAATVIDVFTYTLPLQQPSA